MRRRFYFPVGVALLSIAAAVPLAAHGIWFAERSGDMALVYGEGAEDGDMSARLAGIKGVVAYDALGVEVPTKLNPTGRLLLVDMKAKPAVIAGSFDNGIWTVGPDNEEVNKSKNQVRDAKSSGHYWKYAVHITGDLKKPLGALPGQLLQLTPVKAALPKVMGEEVTLQALFQGKPLADAEVTVDFVNDPEGKTVRTGQDGTVTIRVRNQALNVISVVHNMPTDNPVETDKVQHRATLSFVARKGA